MLNVVLVTVDCLRYDRCGFTGHHRNTTPVLDSLTQESVVFDHAYATGPCTPESFPGIMAGLHSPDVVYQSEIWHKMLPPGTQTIASVFRENEYRTVATVTNPNLVDRRGYREGFDTFQNLTLVKRTRPTGRATILTRRVFGVSSLSDLT